MSMDAAKIICTGCSYQTFEPFRPLSLEYHTSDGHVIKSYRSKGWCYHCAGYADIEQLDPQNWSEQLAGTQNERQNAEQRLHAFSQGLLVKLWNWFEIREIQRELAALDHQIQQINDLFQLLKNRKAKARCLNCWSDNTTPLSFTKEERLTYNFQHDCGGRLKIIYDEPELRCFFFPATIVLNGEGELLREERR